MRRLGRRGQETQGRRAVRRLGCLAGALAATIAAGPVAVALVPGGADPVAPYLPYAVGAIGGTGFYADPVNGRIFGIPGAVDGADPSGNGDLMPAPMSSSFAGRMVDGWDSRVAGERRNIFYAHRTPYRGAGRIETVAGGLCDGRAPLDVAVDPGTVRVDDAGRVFWLDQNWNAHVRPSAYVRVLGLDGTVRTLGTVVGPIAGRGYRDLGSSTGLSRILPDGKGGVYYTYEGYVTGQSPGDIANVAKVFDDVTITTVVGHLSADGTGSFVAGNPGWRWATAAVSWNDDQTSNGWGGEDQFAKVGDQPNDGKPVAQAGFRAITALGHAPGGGILVADGGRVSGWSAAQGANAQRDSGQPDDTPAHADSQGMTIRVLNTTGRDLVVYPGSKNEVRVKAGTVGTIAGVRTDWDKYAAPAAGTMSDPLSTRLTYMSGVDWGADGVVRMLMVDANNVQLLALNTTAQPRVANGVTIPAGKLTVVAGGPRGYAGDGGKGPAARFSVMNYGGWFQGDLAVGPDGAAYVADTLNHRVRRIGPDGAVTTVLGTGTAGYDAAGDPTRVRIADPMGLAVTPRGLVVSDWGNARIRTVTAAGVATLIGTGSPATCGDGGRAGAADLTSGAGLASPHDVAVDSRGNTYVADNVAGVIRRIGRDGRVTTVAGVPQSCPSGLPALLAPACPAPQAAGDGGPATRAVFRAPNFLLVDRYDNLYVSDAGRVRYVNLGSAPITVQKVTVAAGAVQTVLETDELVNQVVVPGGTAPGLPQLVPDVVYEQIVGFGQLALDHAGTLYAADIARKRILSKDWCGLVATLAGTGAAPAQANGDGGPAVAARLAPVGLAWDEVHQVLFVSTLQEWRVRAINTGTTPVTVYGVEIPPGYIDTVAGGAPCRGDGGATTTAPRQCLYGDGASARSAALHGPMGLAVQPGGRLFVADATGNVVRVVEPDGRIGTLAGLTPDISGHNPANVYYMVGGTCRDGIRSYFACLGGPSGVALTPGGDLMVAESLTGRVHRIVDALHAPLRPQAFDAPLRGEGWRFTRNQVLVTGEDNQFREPTLAVDAKGRAYVTAWDSEPAGNAAGCPVWRVDTDADGHGNDTVRYLRKPDVTPLDSAALNTPGVQCSLAVGKPDPLGIPSLLDEDYRVTHTAVRRPGLAARFGVVLSASGSTDAGETFTSVTPGLVTPGIGWTKQAYLAAESAESTVMAYSSLGLGSNSQTGFAAAGFARATAGGAFVHVSAIPARKDSVNGLTRTEGNDVNDDPTGPPAVTNGAIYVPLFQQVQWQRQSDSFYVAQDTVFTVARSTDNGVTWTRSAAVAAQPCVRLYGDGTKSAITAWVPDAYCWGEHGKPSIAADASGRVYATWDEGGHVWLRTSTDSGASWTPRVQVDRGLSLATQPVLLAGAGGRAAVVFLGSTSPASRLSNRSAEYWVYASYIDATGATPRFRQSLASDHRMHTGEICYTSPTGTYAGECLGDGMQGSKIGAYFAAAVSPVDGRVVVAYDQDPGIVVDGVANKGSAVVVTRQCDGPSLLFPNRPAAPCGEAAGRRQLDPLTAARCTVQGTDPAGDASWLGVERDQLDLRSLRITSSGSSLVVRLGVTAPSSDPMPPGGALRWYAQWRQDGRGYWAGAVASTAAGLAKGERVTYEYGHVTGAGTYVYDGDATGTMDATGLTITVPLHGVQARSGSRLYALSARGDVLAQGVLGPDDQPVAGAWQQVDRLVGTYGARVGSPCPGAAATPPAPAAGPAGPLPPLPAPPVAVPPVPAPPVDPRNAIVPQAHAAPVVVSAPLIPCTDVPPPAPPHPAEPAGPAPSASPSPPSRMPDLTRAVAIAVLPPVAEPGGHLPLANHAPNLQNAPGTQVNAQAQGQPNPLPQSGLAAEPEERTELAQELAMVGTWVTLGGALALGAGYGTWQLRAQRATAVRTARAVRDRW